MRALNPPDAAMYWRSRNAVTDQFLLYAFDVPADSRQAADVLDQLRARAEAIADLHLTIEPVPGNLGFPRWATAPIGDDQFRSHPAGTWNECLEAIATLMDGGVDADRRRPDGLWRVHLFDEVSGLPLASGGRGRVVVLQISHALGDGRVSSEIARRLLSDVPSDTVVLDRNLVPRTVSGALNAGAGLLGALPKLGAALVLGVDAWRLADGSAQAHQAALTAPAPPIAATALNHPVRTDQHAQLRTITVARDCVKARGGSVTAGVLAALADTLPNVGGASADGRVVAEVTIAREVVAGQRNNFFTAGIDLRVDLDVEARVKAIAAQIAHAQTRDRQPVRVAERRAAAQSPAILESLAVAMSAASPPPAHVAGTTVVSSVNRGAADLTLAGGKVLFTGGFPALSAVHGLTHGVHGIGDTVTISVAARSMEPATLDRYVAELSAVLRA